jgi:hypothetical protein
MCESFFAEVVYGQYHLSPAVPRHDAAAGFLLTAIR